MRRFSSRSERSSRPGLDDQAGEEVVGARVRLAGARCEERLVRDGDLDELARRPGVPEVAAEVGLEDLGVELEVGEPARVVEQLPDRDRIAVRDEPGEPPLDGVAQAELALADELEDDGGDVGLRDACDPEPVVDPDRRLRVDLAETAGDADRAIAVPGEQDDSRGTGCDERVGVLLEIRLVSSRSPVGLAIAEAAMSAAAVMQTRAMSE